MSDELGIMSRKFVGNLVIKESPVQQFANCLRVKRM